MGCNSSKVDPTTSINKKTKNLLSDNEGYHNQTPANPSQIQHLTPDSTTFGQNKYKTHVKQVSVPELQIPNFDESKEVDSGREKVEIQPKQPRNVGFTPFEKITEILDALKPGELFSDPDFPADHPAITQTGHDDMVAISWKRPQEIVGEDKQPHMLVDGISRDDIKQGILGDCWFLSSCAAVSQQEKFMTKIIPADQPLSGSDYKGIIHFRFWRFGTWLDIYIDDLLPVKNNELIFARGDDPTEFWVPLVEKAYAKLHGSYEAIEGGQTMDALVDLTGGLAERYNLKGADPNMYRNLINAHKSGSFIACSRKGDWRQATKADDNGLVSGHAYTVTNVIRINHRMGEEKLLQIRNPWGNETEWKGSWSDHDSNWNWVDADTKALMKLSQRDDGEFWMCYKDFCRQFQEVTICTMGPDSGCQAGHMEVVKGQWEIGFSAGGSRNDIEKFATNPQYVLTLEHPDTFEPHTDDPEIEGKCSVVIALMQEHRRSHCHLGVKPLQIGFIIYQTDSPQKKLTPRHFKYNYECGKSGIYINLREVSGRFELEPGHYVIIPTTFRSNEQGNFMLRVYAQKEFKLNGPL